MTSEIPNTNGRQSTALRSLEQAGVDIGKCGLLKLSSMEASNLDGAVQDAIQRAIKELVALKRTSKRKADEAYHEEMKPR